MPRDNVLQIRVDDADYDVIQKAAEREDRTVSDWCRRALLGAASRGVGGLGGEVAAPAGDPGEAIGEVVSGANGRAEQELRREGFVGVAEALNGGKKLTKSPGSVSPPRTEPAVGLPTEEDAWRRKFEEEFGAGVYKRMLKIPKLMKLPWEKRFEVAREQKERERGA